MIIHNLANTQEDPFLHIFNSIKKIDPKRIILAGGETPLPLYAKYFHQLNSDCVISDERITDDISRLNQKKLSKHINKLKILDLPKYKFLSKDQIVAIQDSLINFRGSELCILGMGLDGHYASIFPHMDISYTCNKGMFIYCSNQITGESRFSLTPSFLEQSQNIFFILKGNEKVEQLLTFLSNHDENIPIVRFFKHNLAKISLFLIN